MSATARGVSRGVSEQHTGNQDEALAAGENPFRTPEVMRSNRDLKLHASRVSARGLKILWVDGKVCSTHGLRLVSPGHSKFKKHLHRSLSASSYPRLMPHRSAAQ